MKGMRFRWELWLIAAAFVAANPTSTRGANAVAEPFHTAPDPAWWTLSGDAAWDAASQSIFLTHAANDQTGSIFWPWKFETDWFYASFDFWIGGGTGGEGLTFAWVKEESFLGEGGSSLGVGGLDGYAIRFDTCSNTEGEPENYIAFSCITPDGIEDLVVNSSVPEMEDILDGAGKSAPFHVKMVIHGQWLYLSLSNPSVARPIPQTVVFDFEIPDYEPSDSYFGFTAATSETNNVHAVDNIVIREIEMVPTYRFLSGDLVTLSAAAEGAIAYTWKQVAGYPAVALDYTNPPLGVSHFIAPHVEIGTFLTFEVTVEFPDRQETDAVNIEIKAAGPPGAMEWVRVVPIHLGFRLMWAPAPGADEYLLTIEPGYTIDWPVHHTEYTFRNLEEGVQYCVTITARNEFGESLAHAIVLVTAMRNLALPAALGGTSPPWDYVYTASQHDIGSMNNGETDDGNHSWEMGIAKAEDFWGYLWEEPLNFDHVVYFTGDQWWYAGWFTSLTAEYTKDGVNWIQAPNVAISPEYDFTDKRLFERYFSRYDISFSPVRGIGIRIFGTPGGASGFTSISELEVYGIQEYGRFELYGVDGEVPERTTALLDGSHSFSNRGEVTGFQWEQLSGPPVTIIDANSPIAHFDAPAVDTDTECFFKLTANDGSYEGSDEVAIIIRNLTTTADAGPDQEVVEGNEVSLDGRASLTTSGSLTYLWTQTGGETVVLKDADKAVCTFTAPTIWDYTEELRFQLQVDDGLGQPYSVSTDEVVVTVRNSLAWPAYLLEGAPDTNYIRDLLHLGKSPTDRLMNPHEWGNITSGFDPLEKFGGASRIRPYPDLAFDFTGGSVQVSSNPMVWTPVHEDNGFFYTPIEEFQMFYHLYMLSPEDRDVRWHFRHYHEVRIWSNSVLVGRRDSWDSGVDSAEDGLVADGKGLKKGLNSITGWYEGGSSGYFALGITDLNDQPFTDLYYSLGPSLFLTDAYAVRRLQEPQIYLWNETLQVDLVLKINPDSVPQSVIITETIPAGIPMANVSAPGSTVADGKIVYNLTGASVKQQTLSYSLTVPPDFTARLHFEGTVRFDGTTVDIWGDEGAYPVPLPPSNLTVEMLQAAHLSWSVPETEGIASYRIYRSVNGGPFELIGATTATTHTDKWVEPGNTYSYRVTAVNEYIEGEPTAPTPAVLVMTTMEIREAEDFNYGGGMYPGYQDCPPAIEAPDATTIGTPQEYDYYHPNTGPIIYPPPWPQPDLYRADLPWIETVEEADNPGVFATSLGWIDVGSWYRFTFDVQEAGWVKFEFRVASPGGGTLAAYWDENSNGEEQLIGKVTFNTGHWHIFTWALMEEQIQTTVGVHTLRIQSVGGNLNFDKIAIQWNAAPLARAPIWEDDFEDYAVTADVFSPTNGGWTRGNTTNSAGSWTLWSTDGPPLGAESANLAEMDNKYMISNSDLSGEGVLIDEEMISPEVDCTGWTKLRLNFSYNYRIYDDPEHTQDAEVDIRSFDSATGWSGWTNLFHLDTSSVPADLDPPELSGSEVFDLSACDGKKIQLKFHFFNAEYDYWFAIDNVRVSGIEAPWDHPYFYRIVIEENTAEVCVHPEWLRVCTVEYCDDLQQGDWLPIPGVEWPVMVPCCVVDDIGGVRQRFYRIKGE